MSWKSGFWVQEACESTVRWGQTPTTRALSSTGNFGLASVRATPITCLGFPHSVAMMAAP